MVMVTKFGPIAQNMKVIGEMTRPMVMENWCMRMEMSMKVSGIMIKLTGKAHTLMLMELTTMETGLMTSSTDGEWSRGPMAPNTKVSIKMAKKMEEENLLSLMALFTMVNSKKMK